MSRSTELLYRLKETLGEYWQESITEPRMYNALNSAQRFIVNTTSCLEKEITIATVVGQESYSLLDGTADIVRTIISLGVPSDWNPIDILGKTQYVEEKANYSSNDSQPGIASVFNNKLYLHYPPQSVEVLTLRVILKDATALVTSSVAPEIPLYLDDALLQYAAFSLTNKLDFFDACTALIKVLGFLPHQKVTKLNSKPCNW